MHMAGLRLFLGAPLLLVHSAALARVSADGDGTTTDRG